jgi:hypothetical protein
MCRFCISYRVLFLFGFLIFLSACNYATTKAKERKLTFAFLTDVHLNHTDNGNRTQGLKTALDKVKEYHVDFVIFGGDNADIDGIKNGKTADSLYNHFKSIVDASQFQVYSAIGNHDRFMGDTSRTDLSGSKLFEKYFGPTYYSFDQQGIHFIVLNSVQSDTVPGYFVNRDQMAWLRNDLGKLTPSTPIVLIVHVPVLSMYYPAVNGYFTSADMIANFKEVWDAFSKYNLKLTLQGHQHLYEEILSKGNWFVTGGAVCANWWNGAFYGTEEGFLLVEVTSDNEFSWSYIDYGWNVNH